MQKYMVIENFRPGCFNAIYVRFEQQGRMLPVGLNYLGSWVNREKAVCYQLMETDDVSLFDIWIRHWEDLTEFDIVPVT